MKYPAQALVLACAASACGLANAEWKGRADQYTDAGKEGEEGKCSTARGKVSTEDPSSTTTYVKATGTTVCWTNSAPDGSGGTNTYSFKQIFECREGTYKLYICTGGSDANPCGGDCSTDPFAENQFAWNVGYINPSNSKFQHSDTTCTGYVQSGDPNFGATYFDVVQGDKQGFYDEMANICARYSCPSGEIQAIWADKKEPEPSTINAQDKGKYIIGENYKSDFDTCCHTCTEVPPTCDDLIKELKPGGCYAQCGPGITDTFKRQLGDMASCSTAELDKVDEAIKEAEEESKGSEGAGRTYVSAVVVGAVLAALSTMA